MQIEVITGQERLTSPDAILEKLIAFYRAFNQGDMQLMRANWEQSSEASMSNPLGGVKRGWPEIEAVYTRIFDGPARVYVEFYDYSLHQTDAMFIVAGRERGYLQRDAERLELAIRTSRIYRKSAAGWQQLHHHGSIEKPELLSQYQNAVMHGIFNK